MTQAPKWFLVVAVIAILWNLLGCFALAADLSMSSEEIAKLSDAQRELYESRPGWAVAATATAVIAGLLGSIALWLRRKWALPLLVLSLIGILVQDFGLFLLTDAASAAGAAAFVLQGLVLAIGIALVLLSRKGIVSGWLR